MVCPEFETKRLFLHSMLNVYIISVLNENQILRGGATSMICDITNSLEANSGPIQYTQVWCRNLKMNFTVK